MTTNTLDMMSISVASQAVVDAMQSAVCQWEQRSHDAAMEGNLTAALMYKNWAFAAELMTKTASTTLTSLILEVYDAKYPKMELCQPAKDDVNDIKIEAC
jgi:hypothetical protein